MNPTIPNTRIENYCRDYARRFSTNLSRRARSVGFTLVELLVVIGVISVLIAILLPALSAAREQAVRVNCLSNLRQCYAALLGYANEYGEYPTNYLWGSPEAWNWGDECAGNMIGGPPTTVSGPPVYTPNCTPEGITLPPGVDQASAFARLVGSQGIQVPQIAQCPASTDAASEGLTSGYFWYNGPHTSGLNLFNNGALSDLAHLGWHHPYTTDASNLGVSYRGGLISTAWGNKSVSDVAFLACPSIMYYTTSQCQEPHVRKMVFDYSKIDYGNGQTDNFEWSVPQTAIPIGRNFLYGDGHAVGMQSWSRSTTP